MKQFTLLIIFIIHINTCFSQNPLIKVWDKRLGGSLHDNLTVLTKCTDKGFILGGTSWSQISGDKSQPNCQQIYEDWWIIKTDSFGNKMWDKNFGGLASESLFSIIQTLDGGYLLGGSSNSDSSCDMTMPSWNFLNSYDYWVIKIDSIGNKIWDKRYGGTHADYLYSITQSIDGSYVLGGYSKSDSSGNKTQNSWKDSLNNSTFDYWVVKIDDLGNVLWDKKYGGTSDDHLKCLKSDSDGGFILAGYSYSTVGGEKSQPNWDTASNLNNNNYRGDYWVIKIDSTGNKVWDKTFGGFLAERLCGISQDQDGGYVLGGNSSSGISGNKTQPSWGGFDFWIVKIDGSGNKIWEKVYGGSSDERAFPMFAIMDDVGNRIFLLSHFVRNKEPRYS